MVGSPNCNIRMVRSPRNSHDFAVLDLGLLNSVHGLETTCKAHSVAELVEAVENTFKLYQAENFLNAIWHYKLDWKA